MDIDILTKKLRNLLWYLRDICDNLLTNFIPKFNNAIKSYRYLLKENSHIINHSPECQMYCSKIEGFLQIGKSIKIDIEKEQFLEKQEWVKQYEEVRRKLLGIY